MLPVIQDTALDENLVDSSSLTTGSCKVLRARFILAKEAGMMLSSSGSLLGVGVFYEQASQGSRVIGLCISRSRAFLFKEIYSRYRIGWYCPGVTLFYYFQDGGEGPGNY